MYNNYNNLRRQREILLTYHEAYEKKGNDITVVGLYRDVIEEKYNISLRTFNRMLKKTLKGVNQELAQYKIIRRACVNVAVFQGEKIVLKKPSSLFKIDRQAAIIRMAKAV